LNKKNQSEIPKNNFPKIGFINPTKKFNPCERNQTALLFLVQTLIKSKIIFCKTEIDIERIKFGITNKKEIS